MRAGTTIGLILFISCPNPDGRGRLSSAIFDKIHRGAQSDAQKDAKLKRELGWLQMSDLLFRAEAAGVDKLAAARAMDQAPDKSELVELVYAAECSEEGKDVVHLQSLEISELVSLIQTSQAAPPAEALTQISEMDLRRCFRVVDRDSSGEVTADELSAMFGALGSGVEVDPRTAEMIVAADQDGDGAIGYSEFVKIVRKTTTPEW